jgi:hypothetical protein
MLHTQEMPVPVHVQLPVLMKIITFDRNLKKRDTKDLVIGILYQSKFRMSLDVKNQLVAALDDSPLKEVEGAPIRYMPVDLEDQTDLQSTILKGEITVLYITPLRAIDIGSITAVSQALRILSFTAVPDYVDLGVAVGLGTKGDYPQIIINLPSARAEGADFSSQLLKLAKIIR